MKIIYYNGVSLNILNELSCGDIICENLSVFFQNPNERLILLKRGPFFYDINELMYLIESIEDPSIKWLSEEARNNKLKYYNKVLNIMISYKREVSINKLLNDEQWYLNLAC